MIWLTWRQHRKQALVALLGLAVLMAVLIPTGLQMHDAFASTGAERCLNGLGDANLVKASQAKGCDTAIGRFERAYGDYGRAGLLLVFLPLLVGLFWGAPLVSREIESGTHRLVWTQGVGRLRWAVVKVTAITAATVLFAIAYALLISWWFEPLNQTVASRLGFLSFDVQGVAPVGYTLFAIALGIFAGTVTRKVMSAMAVTLIGFVGVRLPLAIFGRPNFQQPVERRYPVVSDSVPNPAGGDWIMSQAVHNGQGTVVVSDAEAICWPPPDSPNAPDCYGPGAFNEVVYQPGDRYWAFQYLETGIYVALAVVLLFLTLRWVQRHRV